MINQTYEQLIEPSNFKTLFKSRIEFESWLDLGTKTELQDTLKAFEEAEEYEICILIKNKILSLQYEI